MLPATGGCASRVMLLLLLMMMMMMMMTSVAAPAHSESEVDYTSTARQVNRFYVFINTFHYLC